MGSISTRRAEEARQVTIPAGSRVPPEEAIDRPSASPRTDEPEVWLVYSRAFTFSGQSGATELIVDGLRERGWSCRIINVPPLNRTISNSVARLVHCVAGVLASSVRLLGITLRRHVVLHLSLGQSLASFSRVGAALLAVSLLRPRLPRAISLHGSVFMSWRRSQLSARIFRLLLQRAHVVTVLGAEQQRHLVALGVDRARVVVLPNTCELSACTDAELERKRAASKRGPLRLLHLSLLIESKGYPEFLEALELLGNRGVGPIEAVLCGPPVISPHCRRFRAPDAKEAWIRSRIDAINLSGSVRVRWVQGARGAAKHTLLREADVFVFPSRYPVEAQPLVLLEAMATGCAIVASTIGEIPSTLDERSAVFLEEPSAKGVAAAIEELMTHPDRTTELARNARDRYSSSFDQRRYADRWATIFSSLASQSPR